MSRGSDHVATADELQGELRDLLCLAVVGDHVRWVLTGDDTEVLVPWLTDAVAQWRDWADQVAKRLTTLGVAPDGRVRSLAADIPFNWVPDGWLHRDEARQLLSGRIASVVEWAQSRRSTATDVDIVRLFDTVCSGLEAQAASLPTD